MRRRSPIQGAVVGQYFTLYDGVSKEQCQKVFAAELFRVFTDLVLSAPP
jgi:hypothetical protein